MIKILAKMYPKAECVEKFVELAKELVECSKAEEANISYSLNKKIDEEGVFCIIEHWRDKPGVDAHSTSEHFTRISKQLAELSAKPSEIEVFVEV